MQPLKNIWFFGGPVGPKLVSELGQVGLKIDAELHANFKFVSEWILEPLGLDFGSLLGSKIGVKNGLKISNVKSVKFDSRVGGSSIFDLSGESKIDEKAMPKGLQERTSS